MPWYVGLDYVVPHAALERRSLAVVGACAEVHRQKWPYDGNAG